MIRKYFLNSPSDNRALLFHPSRKGDLGAPGQKGRLVTGSRTNQSGKAKNMENR